MRLILMIAFLTIACAGLFAGPLETLKPGEWYEVPNSHLYDVRPSGWSANVMDPWSGGAYDTKRDRLLVWGGGHGDYSGNEIYSFDVNTLKWRVEIQPSTDVGGTECSGIYPDGRPRSRHTYNGLQYVPANDRFCSPGAGGFYPGAQCGNARFDAFNFVTLSWEKLADAPASSYSTGQFSAVDPVTGHLFSHGAGSNGNILAEYDAVKNTWTAHGGRWTEGAYSYSLTAAIDPVRRKMIAVGAGEVWQWDITLSGDVAGVKLSTTGATAIVGNSSPGFEYDPVSAEFVAWAGGSDVYTFDLGTNAWQKHSAAPTNSVTPTAAAGHGTFGRFRYIPSKNLFVGVNKITENVFFYKLTAGAGTGAEVSGARGKNLIAVYPDPVRDFATVRINRAFNASKVSLSVYNAMGRKVGALMISGNEIVFPTINLPAGIYLLKGEIGKEKITRAITVLR